MPSMANEPPLKRRKLSIPSDEVETVHEQSISTNGTSLSSLTQRVSPPPLRKALKKTIDLTANEKSPLVGQQEHVSKEERSAKNTDPSLIPSPIHLTKVEGLSAVNNVDTASLRDIVGDPLIRECWVFNYLFDVEFLLSCLDEDVRDEVQVKLVHGSWKKEDSNRLRIEEASSKYKNVQGITAYMPEAFGTHHSKMIINLRHDDTAQVNILTANILPQDFRMSQAVWRSPLLPLLPTSPPSPSSSTLPPIGTGARFGHDLLSYLRHYGSKLKSLTDQLSKFSFSDVRAALIFSVPIRQNIRTTDPTRSTLFGWPALKYILQHVPSTSPTTRSHIVMQVSSIASLGAEDKWFRSPFQEALSTIPPASFGAPKPPKPKFSLVFPCADTIRRSVDGYGSGGSIHLKLQTPQAVKQLEYLRPILCHWASDANGRKPSTSSISSTSSEPLREAGRNRAAPHIKTYIRFADEEKTKVDWAMMTSANLSTQAWGAAPNAGNEVRICSYEIGVVVWPGLWGEGVDMRPVFGRDLPVVDDFGIEEPEKGKVEDGKDGDDSKVKKERKIIGLRMPYDLPLVPYREDEMPWCATLPDPEPDWMGRVWQGY
jgi:tyrosyl-DNA phosphodiesterase-1